MASEQTSDHPTSDSLTCPVCQHTSSNDLGVERHMKKFHPAEWALSNPGLTQYPCDQPDCNPRQIYMRNDEYVAHLSRSHGIDPQSRIGTTQISYLEKKTKETLIKHYLEEARELNELNDKIRDLEAALVLSPPLGGYTSCHGFDLQTRFNRSLEELNGTKKDWVVYHLNEVRICRKQKGPLFSKPGTATRDGVRDDLLEVVINAADLNLDLEGPSI